MKRIFYFAIAAFAATAVMVSCEKDEPKDPNGGGNGNEDDPTKTEKLAAPANFNGTVNGDDLTITWDAVENAVSYSYVVDNSEPATVTEPSVTLSVEALGYGDHTIFVTALPEDGSEQYTASDEAVSSSLSVSLCLCLMSTPIMLEHGMLQQLKRWWLQRHKVRVTVLMKHK